MTMSRAEVLARAFAADSHLRGDLTDDEVVPLLAWATDRLKAWDADPALADPAAWDARVHDLRALMLAMGKFTALRTYAPQADQEAAWGIAAGQASALGVLPDLHLLFDLPGTDDVPDAGYAVAQAAPNPSAPPSTRSGAAGSLPYADEEPIDL